MFVNHVHLLPEVVRKNADLETYLQLAERFSFEGAVCFAPFSYQFALHDLKQNHNVWLQERIADHPELVGYGTLDPEMPAAPQVEQIADLGFRGIKLHPPAQKFPILGDWARDAYAVMERHQLTADFHLGVHGYRLKNYNPLDCDEIAAEFPKLRMVFEHVGGWHYYRHVLAVIINNQHRGNHLYAGIASILDRENQRYWYLGAEGLGECRWQIGPDLLIYGLDFPYNQGPQIERDLALIAALDWPEAEKQALLGGNLRRLLGQTTEEAKVVGGNPVSG